MLWLLVVVGSGTDNHGNEQYSDLVIIDYLQSDTLPTEDSKAKRIVLQSICRWNFVP